MPTGSPVPGINGNMFYYKSPSYYGAPQTSNRKALPGSPFYQQQQSYGGGSPAKAGAPAPAQTPMNYAWDTTLNSAPSQQAAAYNYHLYKGTGIPGISQDPYGYGSAFGADGGAGGAGGAGGSAGDLSRIPGLDIPTRQRQNNLYAQAARSAATSKYLDKLTGSRGITANSGVIGAKMIPGQLDYYGAGASGAANLGIDDQLARDRQLTSGLLGFGNTDIDYQRALAQRQGIGINARNSILDQLISLLGGSFSSFGLGDFGSF